jgi:UDP-glucuronate 4-epimerase
MEMIGTLEKAIGRAGKKEMLPTQPGDIPEISADLGAIKPDFGYTLKTPISSGIPGFLDWYRNYRSDRSDPVIER